MNFLRARFAAGGQDVEAGELRLPVRADLREATQSSGGQEVLVGIRPENLIENGRNPRGATVPVHHRGRGGRAARPRSPGPRPRRRRPGGRQSRSAPRPKVGDKLELQVELDAVHLFDAKTERRIAA